jgi:hypothetical protein
VLEAGNVSYKSDQFLPCMSNFRKKDVVLFTNEAMPVISLQINVFMELWNGMYTFQYNTEIRF